MKTAHQHNCQQCGEFSIKREGASELSIELMKAHAKILALEQEVERLQSMLRKLETKA